mmetsp:Transcript_30131/g.70276  ORF Transcript_30131/g.70276 Transcript_30131/m.70276 type:complete len:188 (-) Transcript_30131:13-576(-)
MPSPSLDPATKKVLKGADGITILESSSIDDKSVTEEELREYAEFLGIDPKREPYLMWIAKGGLLAPVEPPWKACQTQSGEIFYFNFESSESTWDHPADAKYKKLVEEYRRKMSKEIQARAAERAAERAGAGTGSTLASAKELPLDARIEMLQQALEKVKRVREMQEKYFRMKHLGEADVDTACPSSN